jgi:hypothetical protein
MNFNGRGQQYGAPKKSFGEKLAGMEKGVAKVGLSVLELRNGLEMLHTQIRTTNNVARLCDLMDEYLLVAATLAETPASPGAPVVRGPLPPGRIFAAVIDALRKNA